MLNRLNLHFDDILAQAPRQNAEMNGSSLPGRVILACVFSLAGGFAGAQSDKSIEEQLATRQANFRTHYQTRIEKNSAKERSKLDSTYVAALNREIDRATKRGALDQVLTYQAEVRAVLKNESKPDKEVPDDLLRLRKSYQSSIEKIETEKKSKAFHMYKAWDSSLSVFQKQLTRDRKIKDAVYVQEFRRKEVNPILAKFEPADPETRPVESLIAKKSFTNSLGMTFVEVPIDGVRGMGKNLLFCTTETSVHEFKEFLKATDHDATKDEQGNPIGKTWDNPGFSQTRDHPVTMVNWFDAKAFCDWLTKKERLERRIEARYRYRLPTDHEWSSAVGIGSKENARDEPKMKHKAITGIYPWGDQWPPEKPTGNYHSKKTHKLSLMPVDRYMKTAPCGSFEKSKTGLYDLGGNVWEWCEDQWEGKNEDSRTMRGAAWNTFDINHIISSGRRWIHPIERKDFCGFRCVLSSQ